MNSPTLTPLQQAQATRDLLAQALTAQDALIAQLSAPAVVTTPVVSTPVTQTTKPVVTETPTTIDPAINPTDGPQADGPITPVL